MATDPRITQSTGARTPSLERLGSCWSHACPGGKDQQGHLNAHLLCTLQVWLRLRHVAQSTVEAHQAVPMQDVTATARALP